MVFDLTRSKGRGEGNPKTQVCEANLGYPPDASGLSRILEGASLSHACKLLASPLTLY
jgi:hypothetical protein